MKQKDTQISQTAIILLIVIKTKTEIIFGLTMR